MTHFYKGDKLKAVNVLDEDGEPCEGRLVLGEIVTMDDRSSECRDFIIVTRESGKQLQIEKIRFELHECKDVKTVITNIVEFPEPSSNEPVSSELWDLITTPISLDPRTMDYMTGKISLDEYNESTKDFKLENKK